MIKREHYKETLLMPSACSQEPDTAVSGEDLPDPDRYRCGCSKPTIETPMEKLGEGLNRWRGPYLAATGGDALGPVKA